MTSWKTSRDLNSTRASSQSQQLACNLAQSLGQNLDHNLIQNLDQSLTRSLTQNLVGALALTLFGTLTLASSLANAVQTTASNQTAAQPQLSPLAQLQNKLSSVQAGWIAAESSVTRLPESAWGSLLGLDAEETPVVQFDNHLQETSLGERSSGVRTEANASLDWRQRNGANWISPVINQGQCGSCVAFASIGTMEAQMRIESGYSGFNIRLSPQYLFSCGGAYCDFGWKATAAAQFLKHTGAVDEACMPYSSENDTTTSCRKACSDAASRRVRISDFSRPTNDENNINAVKEALKNGPLVTTMDIYKDFMFYAGGIYKHVSGKYVGGHAISIVGYSDRDRAWIVRNSWGPDWGELGFARISYDDTSGVAESTWSYQVQPFQGVSLNHPQDGSYARARLAVQAHVTLPGSKSIHANIYDRQGNCVLSKDLAGLSTNLDLSGLSAGRFEIEVQAIGTGQQVLATSQRHYFFVAGATTNPPATLSQAGTMSTTSGSSPVAELPLGSHLNLSLKPISIESTAGAAHSVDSTLAADIARSSHGSQPHVLQVQTGLGELELTRAVFHYRKLDSGIREAGSSGIDKSATGKSRAAHLLDASSRRADVAHEALRLRDGATITWRTDILDKGRYEYWLTGELDGDDLHIEGESAHQIVIIGL